MNVDIPDRQIYGRCNNIDEILKGLLHVYYVEMARGLQIKKSAFTSLYCLTDIQQSLQEYRSQQSLTPHLEVKVRLKLPTRIIPTTLRLKAPKPNFILRNAPTRATIPNTEISHISFSFIQFGLLLSSGNLGIHSQNIFLSIIIYGRRVAGGVFGEMGKLLKGVLPMKRGYYFYSEGARGKY